jgi:hypothetical protein
VSVSATEVSISRGRFCGRFVLRLSKQASRAAGMGMGMGIMMGMKIFPSFVLLSTSKQLSHNFPNLDLNELERTAGQLQLQLQL